MFRYVFMAASFKFSLECQREKQIKKLFVKHGLVVILESTSDN